MNSLGMPIIGLGARTPDHASLPLQWMPHIQVADVAASVQRALDLDGGALMHHVDDEGRSQWAVLLDPNGAAFGITPVIPAEAMPPSDAFPDAAEPVGRIAWIELTVPDAAAARDFYRQVVGWSVQDAGMEDAGYTMLGEDGARFADWDQDAAAVQGGYAGLDPAERVRFQGILTSVREGDTWSGSLSVATSSRVGSAPSGNAGVRLTASTEEVPQIPQALEVYTWRW